MNRPIAPKGDYCPLWRKGVEKVCHTCPWYTLVRGSNPQTGVEIDEWGCAISFGPILAINTANEARQGAAATESFRNAALGLGSGGRRSVQEVQPPRRLERVSK